MNPTERIARTQSVLKQNNLDGLFVRLNNNVLMMSGYLPINGMSLVLVPAQGDPVLIAPHQDERFMMECFIEDRRFYTWGDTAHMDPMKGIVSNLEAVASEKGLSGGKIAHEGAPPLYALPRWTPEQRVWVPQQTEALRQCFGIAEWTDLSALLIHEASIKTEWEIGKVRDANHVAAVGLEAFRRAVRPGRTEVAVAAEVEGALQTHGHEATGAQFVRAWAHVMSGPNARYACQTYNASTPREIGDGEAVLMELGVLVDGYWSDLTRVHVAGKPSKEQVEVFQRVLEAQELQTEAVRPGFEWAAVDAAGRNLLSGAIDGLHFPHITGHGVGFCYHELSPFIGPEIAGTIEENQIVAIEPGLYATNEASFGGLRLESNFLVTASGAERLDDFDEDLQLWQNS